MVTRTSSSPPRKWPTANQLHELAGDLIPRAARAVFAPCSCETEREDREMRETDHGRGIGFHGDKDKTRGNPVFFRGAEK